MSLSELDRAVLDFEGRFWKYAGAKEAALREAFGVTPVRHYQRVAALLARPEAAEYAPATVRRLRGALGTPSGTPGGRRGDPLVSVAAGGGAVRGGGPGGA